MPFGLPLFLQNGNFPLHSRVKAQRHTAPWQTHPTPRDCQGTAPRRGAPLKCGRNLRFPHKRPLPKMPPAGGSVSPTGRKFLQIRAARHTATIPSSLFTILFPLAPPGGIPRPSIPTPLPGIAKELLPAGALSPPGHGPCPGCVRVGLACPQILSANCSPQGQGASLFHGEMIK